MKGNSNTIIHHAFSFNSVQLGHIVSAILYSALYLCSEEFSPLPSYKVV